jgi:hypothetical protein
MARAGRALLCLLRRLPEHMDAASLSPVQREMLEKIQDPLLRESTRDFMVNRVFRQDYWVRQPRTLSDPERIAPCAPSGWSWRRPDCRVRCAPSSP